MKREEKWVIRNDEVLNAYIPLGKFKRMEHLCDSPGNELLGTFNGKTSEPLGDCSRK